MSWLTLGPAPWWLLAVLAVAAAVRVWRRLDRPDEGLAPLAPVIELGPAQQRRIERRRTRA